MNVLDSFSLAGKIALVTGGATGFGRQITEALAEAGARVITASRNVPVLEKSAAEFKTRGLDVLAYKLDQGEEASIRQLIDKVISNHERIDVLVNNAVSRPLKPGKLDPKAWSESMQVNSTGLYTISELVGEHMKQNGKGSIINISSIYGMIGIDPSLYVGTSLDNRITDYWYHKAGMINYTRYLGSVLGPHNVRVNCISPGGLYAGQPEEFVKRYSVKTFLGRMADESDLKGAIVFFASDASAYITGVNLPLDAGLTAK